MTIILKLSMLTLLLASVPMDANALSPWAQWGLAGLVVGFTLYRDWEREKRMSKENMELGAKIDDARRWQNETLVVALKDNTAALQELKNRPCMADKKLEIRA